MGAKATRKQLEELSLTEKRAACGGEESKGSKSRKGEIKPDEKIAEEGNEGRANQKRKHRTRQPTTRTRHQKSQEVGVAPKQAKVEMQSAMAEAMRKLNCLEV